MENGENPVIYSRVVFVDRYCTDGKWGIKTQLFIEWLLGITWMENGENPVIYSMVVRMKVGKTLIFNTVLLILKIT